MPEFSQELASVESLYDELEQVVGAACRSINDTGSTDDPCFRNLDPVVERSSAAGRRLAALAHSWTEEKRSLHPEERNRLAMRAQSLQQRAVHLQEQLHQLEDFLRKARDVAQASLREIQNGSRFLKSVIPGFSLEPRFLDTRE